MRRGCFGVYLCRKGEDKSSENVRSNLKEQGFVVSFLVPSAGLFARRLCRGYSNQNEADKREDIRYQER